MPLLNLSDANPDLFEAIPSARYMARIFDITPDETSSEDGKVPKGTPLLKVRYKITDPEFEGRDLFQQFTIPPEGYDKKKAEFMTSMLAAFFIAAGEDEKKVLSNKYDPDLEDLKGREVLLVVGQKEYQGEMQNTVRRVLPISAADGTDSGGLL